MDVGQFIRRQVQSAIGPVVGIGLTCYFAYHLVGGERGMLAWQRLTQELAAANAKADAVHAERVAIERRVERLEPQHIDPDLLDEQARLALNLVGPGEVVVFDKAEPTRP